MKQLGKYEILKEIGRGGFGIVYKTRDRSLDRLVALKVLHPQLTVDPKFIKNFKSEAQKLAQVDHPNVVSVHEINEVEGKLFIAMRYLPGGSLADRIVKKPLDIEEVLRIVREVAAGLTAGHERGIIHRDVKPANIIFDDKEHAVVTDFGVAKAVHLSTIGTTSVSSGMVGTPYYRPPELWRGKPKPSPATDVYSLGCVLYEMLTGEVLFTGEAPDQVMTSHVLEDVHELMRSSHVKMPANVQPVLEKALSKDPSERYQSTDALMQALMKRKERKPESLKATSEKAPDQVIQHRAFHDEATRLPKRSSQRNYEKDNSKPAWKDERVGSDKVPSTGVKKKGIPKWLIWGVIGLVAVVLLVIWISNLGGSNSTAEEASVSVQPAEEEIEITEAVQEDHQEEIVQETEEEIREGLDKEETEDTYSEKEGYQAGDKTSNSKDGAEIVYVSKGEFLMGSDECDPDDFEYPEHTVYLDAYWVYKHEVTNAQFAVFLNAQGNQEEGGMTWLEDVDEDARIRQSGGEWVPDSGYGDHPVVEVSWYGAQAYCEWAGGRLPTEAEWEKAARGTDGRTYPWGEESPTCSLAQFDSCSGQTVPVGSFPNGTSPYGALDMAGNVEEWVGDFFDSDYYSTSIGNNPTGPESGDYRVFRGGAWDNSEWNLRTARRFGFWPNSSHDRNGFRCILEEVP